MKRYSKYALWTAAIVFVLVMLVVAFLPKAQQVTVAKVERGPLRETLTAEGMTRYHDTYVVSAPISGLLTRTEFEAGAKLGVDQVLAEILPPVLSRRQVEELRERLESAEALDQEAANHITTAKTALDQARREKSRVRLLIDRGAVTREEFERDSDAVEQTEQDLHAAEARARATHHDAEAIRASLLNTNGIPQMGAIPLVAPVDGILLQVYERNAREVVAGTPLAFSQLMPFPKRSLGRSCVKLSKS